MNLKIECPNCTDNLIYLLKDGANLVLCESCDNYFVVELELKPVVDIYKLVSVNNNWDANELKGIE